MMRERTRASSRIRLPTHSERTRTYSIVERIFVGTKLTMTAPSQNGSVLRNPPTGNVLGAWPSLFIFVEGVESLREEALPLRVRHDRTRDEDDNKRPAQEWVQNSLKFWLGQDGSNLWPGPSCGLSDQRVAAVACFLSFSL